MDLERDISEILRQYEITRQGHLEGDASKLLCQYGSQWGDLRNGTVVVRTFEEELMRTTEHLAGMRYLAWDDANPPRVELSADGTLAWLLGEIRAKAMQTQEDGSEREIAYRCAWLQVYARREDRWVAIVNAPTVQGGVN